MRPSWIYKSRRNIISIEKEEEDFGVVIQDNLSPEKHIGKIFGDAFMMAFHFLDKYLMRKVMRTMIRPILEHAEKESEKAGVEIRKYRENN